MNPHYENPNLTIATNNGSGFKLGDYEMKNKTLLILPLGLLVTGCSSHMGKHWGVADQGRIEIHADAEGMRSFGDMITGAIVQSKASPDQPDTPHYQLRREQENTRRIRYIGPVSKAPQGNQRGQK
jgi:hypothetical protein